MDTIRYDLKTLNRQFHLASKQKTASANNLIALEYVLLRSFGVSPAEVSNVRSFNDLVEVFKPDQEPSPDTEKDMRIDNDLENQVDADRQMQNQ